VFAFDARRLMQCVHCGQPPVALHASSTVYVQALTGDMWHQSCAEAREDTVVHTTVELYDTSSPVQDKRRQQLLWDMLNKSGVLQRALGLYGSERVRYRFLDNSLEGCTHPFLLWFSHPETTYHARLFADAYVPEAHERWTARGDADRLFQVPSIWWRDCRAHARLSFPHTVEPRKTFAALVAVANLQGVLAIEEARVCMRILHPRALRMATQAPREATRGGVTTLDVLFYFTWPVGRFDPPADDGRDVQSLYRWQTDHSAATSAARLLAKLNASLTQWASGHGAMDSIAKQIRLRLVSVHGRNEWYHMGDGDGYVLACGAQMPAADEEVMFVDLPPGSSQGAGGQVGVLLGKDSRDETGLHVLPYMVTRPDHLPFAGRVVPFVMGVKEASRAHA
jgi:hypothetical protein